MWWWLLSTALAGDPGVPVVLPGGGEVVIATDAKSAVEDAMALLSARRFGDAARAFGALADASGDANLRYLEAVARYEGAELRPAERATQAGLARDPRNAPLWSLRGLILADLGRGEEALAAFDRGEQAAAGDPAVMARISLNRGLVRLDRGEASLAEVALRKAIDLGGVAKDVDLVARATDNLALVDQMRGRPATGGDTITAVSDRLRRGDVKGARAAIPATPPPDRRGAVRHQIALAGVARAEGRVSEALQRLEAAAALAGEGGLVREQAAALAQIGTILGAAGRRDAGLDKLQQAIGLVSGSSLRVNELTYRVEAGRIAVRLGDLGQADGQLAAARVAAKGNDDVLGQVRLAELEGVVAGLHGDAAKASTTLEGAIKSWDTLGYVTEAARVAADLVEQEAAAGSARLPERIKTAEALFARANDPLGPAHVGISEGLGQARRGAKAEALAAFVRAAERADAVATARAKDVAAIARQNAASLLVDGGMSSDAAAKASQAGLDQVVAREKSFRAAEVDFKAGIAAMDAKRWDEARDKFGAAERSLSAIGEASRAADARRARLWATFSAATDDPASQAIVVYRRVAEEASALPDPELRARATAAVGLTAHDLHQADALATLRAAGPLAEAAGLTAIAGQVWAVAATEEPKLPDRVAAARRAYDLRAGDDLGTFAMYAVAVDAYNDDQLDLAEEIAVEILPKSGKLQPKVTEVLAAIRGARGG